MSEHRADIDRVAVDHPGKPGRARRESWPVPSARRSLTPANTYSARWRNPIVYGTPSAHHELTGNATWTGEFVGFNFNPAEMTALTADAEMAYSFAENEIDVAIGNFATWLGDTAYAEDWGPFVYVAPCSDGGCGARWDGYVVDVGFYEHEGDPSGYAAGRLHDALAGYAGAFGGDKN